MNKTGPSGDVATLTLGQDVFELDHQGRTQEVRWGHFSISRDGVQVAEFATDAAGRTPRPPLPDDGVLLIRAIEAVTASGAATATVTPGTAARLLHTQSARLSVCDGCRVAPGSVHREDCDHARCPDCGEQLFMHECEHWPEDAEGPDRDALWHGVDQRDMVARALGWWREAAGLEGMFEDDTRVLFAKGLNQVTWDRQSQTYVIWQIDEAAIDAAMAEG